MAILLRNYFRVIVCTILRTLLDPSTELADIITGQCRTIGRHLKFGIQPCNESEQFAFSGFRSENHDHAGIATSMSRLGIIQPQSAFGLLSAVTFPTCTL